MAARMRKALDENQKGFTLVELLVVVIIIGILAAIAIPVYLGQKGDAQDAAAKADLANAKTAFVVQLVEDPATPSVTTATPFSTLIPTFEKSSDTTALTLKSYNASTGAFCLFATSGSTTTFYTKQTGGISTTSC